MNSLMHLMLHGWRWNGDLIEKSGELTLVLEMRQPELYPYLGDMMELY